MAQENSTVYCTIAISIDTLSITIIITILCYSFILIVIACSSSHAFKSSFFFIFKFIGFFDVVGLIAVEYTRMDLKMGFGPSLEPFTRGVYAFTGITFFTHIAGCFLMTLNRYTAVCHPLKHESIWSLKVLCSVLILNVMLSVAVCSPLFFVKLLYVRRGDMWANVGRESDINVGRFISCAESFVFQFMNVMLLSKTVTVIFKTNRCIRKRLEKLIVGTPNWNQSKFLVTIWFTNCLKCFFSTMQHLPLSTTGEFGSLIVMLAIDCALYLLESAYQIAAVLRLKSSHALFIWLDVNYELLLFLIWSLNPYYMLIFSRKLQIEAFAFLQRKRCLFCCCKSKTNSKVTNI